MRENYNNWVWFALKNQDELYSVISTMIEDKVKELLPQMVSDYFKNFTFDFRTMLNGKQTNSLNSIIIDTLIQEMK